jgi:predicted flap endonuclease-1-like 5' DNA nuclease
MLKACANGHTFEKTSDCPTCPTCERERMAANAIPKIGAPATRALENAGVHHLEQLANWSETDLLALHGMGPRAVGILREQLAAQGLDFAS